MNHTTQNTTRTAAPKRKALSDIQKRKRAFPPHAGLPHSSKFVRGCARLSFLIRGLQSARYPKHSRSYSPLAALIRRYSRITLPITLPINERPPAVGVWTL